MRPIPELADVLGCRVSRSSLPEEDEEAEETYEDLRYRGRAVFGGEMTTVFSANGLGIVRDLEAFLLAGRGVEVG